MLYWRQTLGVMEQPPSGWCAYGYSGQGAGLNNHAMQDDQGIGPIPCGLYTLGAPMDHPRLGRYAIPLTPHPGNVMYGRSEFFIHGDNPELNHSASHGCIVLAYGPRLECAANALGQLTVTT